jgi:hypothetical protein
MNLTSQSLLATSVKRRYTMTSDCDRKMSLRNKHLSNGWDLPVTLLQFTSRYPEKHTPVTIVILTSILTRHNRICRIMVQNPDPSFSEVIQSVCA